MNYRIRLLYFIGLLNWMDLKWAAQNINADFFSKLGHATSNHSPNIQVLTQLWQSLP